MKRSLVSFSHLTFFVLLYFIHSLLPLPAQDYQWHAVAAFNTIDAMQEVGDNLFYLSEGNLFVAPKSAPLELQSIGREKGLTDNGIVDFCYAPEQQTLILYYRSGTLDFLPLEDRPAYSQTAIASNLSLSNKSLSRMLPSADKLYLSGGFGVSRVDVATGNIEATYWIGGEILDVARIDQKLYVLQRNGTLWQGDENNNLQDPQQWHMVSIPQMDGVKWKAIAAQDQQLFLLAENGNILYRYSPSSQQISELTCDVQHLFFTHQGVAASHGKEVLFFATASEKPLVIPLAFEPLYSFTANASSDDLYLSVWNGLLHVVKGLPEPWQWVLGNMPSDNRFFASACSGSNYYAVGGGRTTDRSWILGTIKRQTGDGSWHNIRGDNLLGGKPWVYDLVSVAVDPHDREHYYVSSWGEGLIEMRGDEVVNHYSIGNSPLESALPQDDHKENYVRVGSLAFDNSGGLWMTQGSLRENIRYLSSAGEWSSWEIPEVAEVNAFGKTLVLSNNIKAISVWHRGLSGSKGLLLLSENGTPSDRSDDKILYIPQFVDRSGKIIETSVLYDMVEDRNGDLWIGSNKGPLILRGISSALNQGKIPVATRPVGGVEPSLYYVLDNVPITAIAVDVSNHKWVGTQSDGLYLLSEDGSQILEHYTRYNSPLLSNSIATLALSEDTGLLYIGTDAGLNTFLSGSSEFTKEDRGEVHVYPNPLRPEDPDKLTITGTVSGMEIKVTDSAGSLVYQAVATGASHTFNARQASGDRYAPGIYHLFLYAPSTKVSHSLQFAIIQ